MSTADLAPIKALVSEEIQGYSRHMVDAVGSIHAAILFRQITFWLSKKGGTPDGFIWKSHKEFYEETRLTRREQDSARKRLIERGVLEVVRRGVPATLHYRVTDAQWQRVAELLANPPGAEQDDEREDAPAQPVAQIRQTGEPCTDPPKQLHTSAQLHAQKRPSLQSITQSTTAVKKPPQPPTSGGRRTAQGVLDRRNAQGEMRAAVEGEKFYQGQFPLCKACDARPCLCAAPS